MQRESNKCMRRSFSDNTMMQFVYFYFDSYIFIFRVHPLCHSQVHASVRILCSDNDLSRFITQTVILLKLMPQLSIVHYRRHSNSLRSYRKSLHKMKDFEVMTSLPIWAPKQIIQHKCIHNESMLELLTPHLTLVSFLHRGGICF